MIQEIPDKNNRVVQINKGDFEGNIYASWNMDFTSNPGAVRVSPQTTTVMSDLDSTPMLYPMQFVEGDFKGAGDSDIIRIWAICDKGVFYTTNTIQTGGGWTKDATSNTPVDLNYLYTDGVEWNGSLIVSNTTDLYKLTAGTWTKNWWTGGGNLNQSSLTSTVAHPLGKGFNNLLLIGDYSSTYGAVVYSVDASNNVSAGSASRVIMGKDFRVVWIRSSATMIYIGCKNINGGRAKVFAWDGASQNFNYDYKLGGSECYAGLIKDEVPYTMNERGELLALSGSGFTQLSNLPVFNTDYNLVNSSTVVGNIGRNAMVVQDNKIHVLVNAYTDGALLENQLSGIWVYDPKVGFSHRYSVTKDTGANILDYGSPRIDFSGALLALGKSNGNILIGCSLFVAGGINVTTLRHCLLTINNNETDTNAKLGYFITSKLTGNSIEEGWQKCWLVIKKFLSANSKVILKYRIADKAYPTWGTYVEGTWATTTSFTTGSSTSDISVGDEVEVLSGEGSGLSAHITNINSTLITIDETIAGASGTIMVRASNWTKSNVDMNYQLQENFKVGLGLNSTWIQFKVVGFFFGKEEIKKLIILSDSNLPIK